MRIPLSVSAVAATVTLLHPTLLADDQPLAEAARQKLTERFQSEIQQLDQAIRDAPNRVDLYSRRGDAHFFLGQFDKALSDYESMVELDKNQGPSHWRRGNSVSDTPITWPSLKALERLLP